MENDDLLANQEKKSRRCLKCNAEFESEGPHNRICPQCKKLSCWKNSDPVDPQFVQTSARRKGSHPHPDLQMRTKRC